MRTTSTSSPENAVAMAQEAPARLDLEHARIEVENERIRAIRIRSAPGERWERPSHAASVDVLLTDAHLRYTDAEGEAEEIRGRAGQVISLPAPTHGPENLGQGPFELLRVEPVTETCPLPLSRAPGSSFNRYLLSVEFREPGGEAWSAIGGGETIEEAVDVARGFLPEGFAWEVAGWNDWWGW